MTAAHNPDMFRLAVDIGGTFTDIVLVGVDGTYWTKKVPSPTSCWWGSMEPTGPRRYRQLQRTTPKA